MSEPTQEPKARSVFRFLKGRIFFSILDAQGEGWGRDGVEYPDGFKGHKLAFWYINSEELRSLCFVLGQYATSLSWVKAPAK